MRKSYLLILPLFALMMACNNSSSTTETSATPADSTAATTSAAPAPETAAPDSTLKDDGTSAMPAQVFDELTAKPVSGATVVAADNGKSVETATTTDKGAYSYTKLTAGKTYSYTVTKTGYASQTATAVYDGTNSLPGFALKTK
ncbi:MAG: carboxypeptidase-like regulatory domain-containing protein [Chitinophagales bacterium]